ncbi:MAG: mandelate racemase/muconate lactonizing enzyme family protein [Hyphomicrobiaceae bacterium]
MRIERIETIALEMPLPRIYRGSFYDLTHRATLITRVYTDQGIVGEIYNGDDAEVQKDVARVIDRFIAPALVGADVFNIEGCWEKALPVSFNIRLPRKVATTAIAAVDSALWDALGKALGQPLYKLWGGYRDRLPVICIAGYYEDGKTLADYGREMEDLRRRGFAGCKFKVGGRSPQEDAARVRAAREGGGPDFVLAVDANQAYSVADALAFCRLVEDLDIRWFEEPCSWRNDRLAMAHVRKAGGIPVAAGQSEYHLAACRDLMIDGAIDVCNFDSSWGSGPTEWRRVAAVAHAFGVQMAHHEEMQVSAHLLAAIPHGTYVEAFHPDRDPLMYALPANLNPFENGLYRLPEGPGYGITLDQGFVARYRL